MTDRDRAHRCRRWAATLADDVGGAAGGRDLVDWRHLGRRVWLLALTWLGFGLLGAGMTTALLGSLGPGALWAGVAALGFLASVVAAVALSAVRGMLRAGERRERLAGGDVGLLPPQVRTRLRPTQGDPGRGECP